MLSPRTVSRLKSSFALEALESQLLLHQHPSQGSSRADENERKPATRHTEREKRKELCGTQKFYAEMARGALKMSEQLTSSVSQSAGNAPSSTPQATPIDVKGGEAGMVASKKPSFEDPLPVSLIAHRLRLDGWRRNNNHLNPVTVTRRLLDTCLAQTEPIRSYMEVHPEQRQPSDNRQFPGKLDHTTCLSFIV